MEISKDILRYDELIIFKLRTIYNQYGYTRYKMNRFEEYELYADNKAFLPSGDILTFTGVNGKLMALRPDVTLSIVKNEKADGKLKKLYYNENVYRSDGVQYKEQMQVGLECIGKIDINIMGEVLLIAKRSLEAIGDNSRLDVSHMGFLGGLIESEHMTQSQTAQIVSNISDKNISELKKLCAEYGLSSDFNNKIVSLTSLYGTYQQVSDELRRISVSEETDAALREIEELDNALRRHGIEQGINIDFSIVNDISYYNGIIFQGYVEGISAKVLSGGRYDELVRRFNKNDDAIGFAVFLDLLEKPQAAESGSEAKTISIALPTGRLGEKAYEIFKKSGYECPEMNTESRKLVFENPGKKIRYFRVKPSDVAVYVERGVADIGVVGSDVLLENSKDVYHLLDLGIGKCAMYVAAGKDANKENIEKTLRVATKYPNVARRHYLSQGREIDIIKLNGSIELAPLLGLADVVVDIVETGKTLQENKLETIEKIVDVSARLISNKASYKFNHEKINDLCARITEKIS
jgi:ATP phosphoribosyltransferase regulatory subunit